MTEQHPAHAVEPEPGDTPNVIVTDPKARKALYLAGEYLGLAGLLAGVVLEALADKTPGWVVSLVSILLALSNKLARSNTPT